MPKYHRAGYTPEVERILIGHEFDNRLFNQNRINQWLIEHNFFTGQRAPLLVQNMGNVTDVWLRTANDENVLRHKVKIIREQIDHGVRAIYVLIKHYGGYN